MKEFLPQKGLLISLLVLVLFFIQSVFSKVYSAADHIVISEIQIAGLSSNDEFVELYNPSSVDINITGWKLIRKTSSGNVKNLVASLSGKIKAHGFFLIAHPLYDGEVLPDILYSATSSGIASNNTVLIYDSEGMVVDKVGMGETVDFESSPAPVPEKNGSLERKADVDSTSKSMIEGRDKDQGNGEDSDNNNNDFIVRDLSDPQNSSSDIEPVLPTSTFIPTPTAMFTVTPTISPTQFPTATLTPTFFPSPTIVPTVIPARVVLDSFYKTCYLTFKEIHFSLIQRTILFPTIECERK